jgi:radical SAM protein with 4Fe4S-binding SPASM domain
MTPEVASRAIAVWRDLMEPGSQARSTVRFFGGEPMLNWLVMAQVLHELEDSESPVLLNTNGTLLRSEHVDAFGRLNGRLQVALSCDGVAESHDAARRDSTGRGTFEYVDAAAQLLAGARIPLCINAVIGVHNYQDLPRLADYALLLRDRYQAPVSLGLELVIPPPAPSFSTPIIDSCVQAVTQCLVHGLPVTGNLTYAFEALLNAHGASGVFCGAVGAELCVGPDGSVGHCPALPLLPFSDLETVAHLGEIPDPLSWRDRCAGNLPGCRGCEIEGLCGGGCAAQSYAACGNVFGTPPPLFCALIRRVFFTCLEHHLEARVCA